MTTRGNGHAASETSKQVVRRWFEAMEHHALDEAVACWAPDAVNHASGRSSFRPARGSEALKRSEEHTSELQSHLNLVCRLLLEKKKSNFQDSTRRLQSNNPWSH